jgi:hypothetical protein
MKDIKDMNLAEAITALRDVDVITRGYHCNFDAIEELANRIDTLLFEQAQRHDAWVDALENRINSLEAKHRWIPVEERMPTEEDGAVRCTDKCDPSNEFVAKIIKSVLKRWTIGGFDNMGWYEVNSWEFNYWQRITPPEDKP